MNSYIEIIRPANAVMASIAVFLMAVISNFYSIDIILGALCVFIATGAGNTINDYFDYEIDKINKPNRPIPSGRISLSNALYYSLLLFVVACIIGFYISLYNGIIAVLCSAVMIIYAYDFKRRCFIGNFSVAVLTGLTFVFGSIITDNLIVGCVLAFFAFLMTLSREIVKDAEDVEGDLEENSNTIPIRYGKPVAVRIAFILNIITCILSPLLYIYNIFSVYYLIIVIVADIMFIYYGYRAIVNQEKDNLHIVSKYMKIAMFIAFISFIVGSIF